ncbi:unnamed protein product [Blepharisma stoltei]|uniref:MYND-type domain-containing protein n=1 Tax=Blepharisma stoltei TaxID=1481888 RepID=A0AAU9IUB8_9CILI|nr:unnamed protein product [Blepharisma stoltei]
MDACENCKRSDVALMQCSSCHRVAYCSQACQKSNWKVHKLICDNPNLVQWDPELVENFLNFMIESIDIYKILLLIDRVAAQKYQAKLHSKPSRHDHDHGHEEHGCSHKAHSIVLDQDSTTLEKVLAQATSRSRLYELLPEIAKQAADIFKNIKEKGLKDGLTMDEDTEKQVLKQLMEEAMSRRIQTEVNSTYRREEETFSKQPMLFAHPSGFQETVNKELDILTQETMESLMTRDYAIQDNFLDNYNVTDKLFEESEYLDFDGKFEELLSQKLKKIRTDKVLWIPKDTIDASIKGKHETPLHLSLSYCPAMQSLSDHFFSIPFELNKKTNLSLQVNDRILLDCFSVNTYHYAHMDSGFGKDDSGKKITCIYMITKGYGERIIVGNEEIPIVHNRLVILKSRKVQITVPETSQKFFLAYYFISGPCDPYQ